MTAFLKENFEATDGVNKLYSYFGIVGNGEYRVSVLSNDEAMKTSFKELQKLEIRARLEKTRTPRSLVVEEVSDFKGLTEFISEEEMAKAIHVPSLKRKHVDGKKF